MKHFFNLFLVTLAFHSTVLAKTIYVNTAVAGGANDGTSWADAYTDLQSALGDATLTAGDQIWVAKGTYYPSEKTDPADARSATFQLQSGVAIYGGFRGLITETLLTDRPLTANTTILSGDLNQDDSHGANNSENAYHVVIGSNTDSTAVLDGFTISAGYANDTGADNKGAGLYISNGSPTLTNCVFRDNEATARGGAIFNSSNSSPTITNCSFSGNSAGSYGGAVSNDSSSPVLTNCSFSGNLAGTLGGGISNEASSPILTNCSFSGNLAHSNGGAIFINGFSSPTLFNCIIWNNKAGNSSTSRSASVHEAYHPSLPYATYLRCLVQNLNPAGNNLNGTTSDNNPLFLVEVDPSSAPTSTGDLRLTLNSPAIGVGNNTAYTNASGPATDLSGNTRQEGTIDLGAYETSIYFVNASNASPSAPYNSWATAANDLQDVLALASSGDQAYIAQGTYTPTEKTEPADARSATFLLQSGIALIGGFDGSETLLAQQDHAKNTTILSGDIGTPVDTTDNAYHVIIGSDTNRATILDGFTITAGYANGNTTSDYNKGAALLNDSGSPTLKNCSFVDNEASGRGGALFNTDNFFPCTITNCSFSGNTAGTWGGAISNDASSPNIKNCVFTNNSASNKGGAVSNQSGSSPIIEGCTLSDNTASNDGGAMVNASSSPILTNCSLAGNSAGTFGGAIFNTSASPTLTNCTLSGNSADFGGAMHNVSSTPSLTNCSLSGNSAATDGGAIRNNASDTALANCIIWNNHANGSTTSESASVFNDSSPTYSHCLVENMQLSGSNLDGTDPNNDPLFLAAIAPSSAPSSTGDLRLQSNSPVIDMGDGFDNASSQNPSSTDLAGNNRFVGNPTTSIDLGAYESYEFTSPDISSFTLTTADTTDANQMEFALTFDEDIYNFNDATDLEITTTGTLAYSSVTVTGSGSNYTITLNSISGEGAFTIAIKTDTGITDFWGNVISANISFQHAPRRETSTSPTHYVNADSSGRTPTAPYNTWNTAATNLQDALIYATSGDQVWVAQGTYYPDQGIEQTDDERTSSFHLQSGIAIYGGFLGVVTETQLTDRDYTTNTTTLSGDLKQDDLNGAFISNNAYHVVVGSDTASNAILDGFTITAGYANGDDMSDYNKGAGLYTKNGSPTLKNCSLIDNEATGSGGAIYNYSSSLTLTNCLLSGNLAGSAGGAIHSSFSSSSALTNCSLLDNTSGSIGGGIYTFISSSTLTNCSLSGNSADSSGGAIASASSSTHTLTNCSLSGNSAGLNGGAIQSFSSSLSLTNCSLSGNSADSITGGLYTSGSSSSTTLTNCIIWNNSSNGSTNLQSSSIYNNSPTPTSFSYCLVENWALTGSNLDGTKSQNDPLFVVEVDPTSAPTSTGDLRLKSASPAIDQGDGIDNASSQNSSTTDLSGNSRFVGAPVTTIDLGAYESYDFTSPDISTFILTTADTTDASQLEFALTFDEDIYKLNNAADLDITTTGTLAYSGVTVTGSGSDYTITLNSLSGEGAFTIAIKTNTNITDLWGNQISANISFPHAARRETSTSPTHYVNVDSSNSTPTPPYSTWETAATNLQDALIYSTNGDQVWVAQGTYYPDQGLEQTDNDRSASFELQTGVAIYGGFTGSEGHLSQRSHATNTTTLSGDLNQDDSSGANTSDNAYHVVIASDTANTAILDGFTITAGNADQASSPDNRGGGIYMVNGEPSITNCIITANSASNNGGGLYNSADRSPSPIITPYITNCVFSGNVAGGRGGAMINSYTTHPFITNCTFSGNSATTTGGGAIRNFESFPTFTNCIIWNNQAASVTNTAASSIVNDQGAIPAYSHCLLENIDLSSDGTNSLDGTAPANNPNFVTSVDPSTAPTVAGDLRLQSNSPVINLGDGSDNASSQNTSATDLAGAPRFNGDIDLGSYEGAYESNSSITFANYYDLIATEDANGNGRSNFLDYTMGADPYAADDTSVMPTISGNQLTFHHRTNASDVTPVYQISSDLINWTDMTEGSYYTVESTTISGIKSSTTVTLETALPSPFDTNTSKLFFQQSVAEPAP